MKEEREYLIVIEDRNGNTSTITLTTVNGSTRPLQVTCPKTAHS